MRKTQMLIAVNCMDSKLRNLILDTLNHFEGVTSIFEDGMHSKQRISEIHANNKSAAFCPHPFRIVENLAHRIIVINAFTEDIGGLHNYYENVIVVGDNQLDLISQIQNIADKYDVDLGDYISEDGMVQNHDSSQDCLLCQIYKNDWNARKKLEESDDYRCTPSMMNIVLYESENFYVVPAKGALVEGYVMIVPKQHYLSFAALEPDVLQEAYQVLEDLKAIFGKIYKTDHFLIFEHGSGKEGTCKHKKSIVHAHLHFIPSPMLMSQPTKERFQLRPVSLDEIGKYKEVPYLLYSDYEMSWHISANPNVYLPRQCIRQLLGDELGLSGQLWNWRRHSFMSEIEDTVNAYYRYLQYYYLTLDSRIAQATNGFMFQMNRRLISE